MLAALPWLGLGAVGTLAALGLYGSTQLVRPPRCTYWDRPANWGLPWEEVAFPSADGLRLRGWLIPQERSRAAVIVLHGHGGNKDSSLPPAAFLHPSFTVLCYDARGHGESEGDRTSLGYQERLDVQGAVAFLRGRGYGPIGALGLSMGAATAIIAAAHQPEIAAVVADCPFATLRSPLGAAIRQRGYPLAPVLATLVQCAAALRLGCRPGDLDPVRFVGRIAPRPLLLIHGADDDLIPVHNAYALYAAAGEPKELWIVPGARHAECYPAGGVAYHERVRRFFVRALTG